MSNKAEHSEHDLTPEQAHQPQPGRVTQGKTPLHGDDLPEGVSPEDIEGEIGAEGGSHGSADTATPFHPAKDDKTPLGDTDQHSNA